MHPKAAALSRANFQLAESTTSVVTMTPPTTVPAATTTATMGNKESPGDASKSRLNYASIQAKWTDLEGRQMKTMAGGTVDVARSAVASGDLALSKSTKLPKPTSSAVPSTSRSSSPDVVVIAETPPILSVATTNTARSKTQTSSMAASGLAKKTAPPVITLDASPVLPATTESASTSSPSTEPVSDPSPSVAGNHQQGTSTTTAREPMPNLVPAIMEDEEESVAGIRCRLEDKLSPTRLLLGPSVCNKLIRCRWFSRYRLDLR